MYNMGHTTIKTFEQRYKNSQTLKETEEYWAITPPKEVINVTIAKFGNTA